MEPGVVLGLALVHSCVFLHAAPLVTRRTGARMRGGGRVGSNVLVANILTASRLMSSLSPLSPFSHFLPNTYNNKSIS